MERSNRSFQVALLVATLFHLSMVTLFSVVIRFERSSIHYYNFELIDPRRMRPAETQGAESSPFPPLGDKLTLAGADAADPWQSLPAVELPSVKFAELDRVRLRERSLQLRTELSDFSGARARDSWQRFSGQMASLGSRLSGLTLFGGGEATDEAKSWIPVAHPAEGFEAHIEWMSEPKERSLLFAPPIQVLLQTDPTKLATPITMVFRVNSAGKVVEVQLPVEDDAGLVLTAARALEKYQFEPLTESAPQRDQYGTFLLTPAAPESQHD